MATDIKISELNEITNNDDLNQIVVNDRENSGDSGITKKIQVSNLLTPNIVKTVNITNCAVITNKINDKAVTNSKIQSSSISPDKLTCGGPSWSAQQLLICGDGIVGGLEINQSVTSAGCAYIDFHSTPGSDFDSRIGDDSAGLNFIVENGRSANFSGQVNIPHLDVINKLTVGAIGGGKTVSLNGINYDFPSTEIPNYFLRTDGSGNLAWAEAVPGDGTALVFSEISPVGTIISWAGAALPSDGKWLECNGTTFDGTDFPELSSILGDTWGTHSGNNYYLPDLKGRAAVGAGTGNDGTDTCNFVLGTTGGKYNHTLTEDEIPAHNHTINNMNARNIYDRDQGGGGYDPNTAGSITTEATGGGLAHNNIQPYAVTRYIIKALPDDIQQFGMSVGPGLSALNASGGQTASIDLSSSEIGLKVTDDFQFDGSNRLTLNDNVSASSITFDDGSVQSTASLIIAGSVAANGTVNTGTGFTSVRNSEGRYTITLPSAGTGKNWMVTANAHSVNTNGGQWYTTSFEPHTVELVYIDPNIIQLNVKIGNYNGGWVAQYDDAIVNFIAVKSDI